MPADTDLTCIVDEVTVLVDAGRSADAASRLPAALVDPADRWPSAESVLRLVTKLSALPSADEHRGPLLGMVEREVEWVEEWRKAGVPEMLASARACKGENGRGWASVGAAVVVAVVGGLAWFGVASLPQWYLRVPLALVGVFSFKVAARIVNDAFTTNRRRNPGEQAATANDTDGGH